jgi:hypothetical protein
MFAFVRDLLFKLTEMLEGFILFDDILLFFSTEFSACYVPREFLCRITCCFSPGFTWSLPYPWGALSFSCSGHSAFADNSRVSVWRTIGSLPALHASVARPDLRFVKWITALANSAIVSMIISSLVPPTPVAG